MENKLTLMNCAFGSSIAYHQIIHDWIVFNCFRCHPCTNHCVSRRFFSGNWSCRYCLQVAIDTTSATIIMQQTPNKWFAEVGTGSRPDRSLLAIKIKDYHLIIGHLRQKSLDTIICPKAYVIRSNSITSLQLVQNISNLNGTAILALRILPLCLLQPLHHRSLCWSQLRTSRQCWTDSSHCKYLH